MSPPPKGAGLFFTVYLEGGNLTNRFGLKINYNYFIDNNLKQFVILNEVKNLFLHKSRFIGIFLIHMPDASRSLPLSAAKG